MDHSNRPTKENKKDITQRLIDIIRNLSEERKKALLKELEDEEEQKGIELRKHERRPCKITAMYTSGDSFGEEYVRDISIGGVFIETTETFEIGQKLSMAIPFTNEERYIKVQGKVVRITSSGIGVEFEKSLKQTG